MATIKFWGDSEIRTNDDSSIDEIVVQSPSFVHLEQMDDGIWLLMICSYEHTDTIHIGFTSRGKIKCTAETDGNESSTGGVSVGFKS